MYGDRNELSRPTADIHYHPIDRTMKKQNEEKKKEEEERPN